MSTSEPGSLPVALLLLLVGAHVFGISAERMRQPRLVGEIMAGIFLGPSLFGHIAPHAASSIFGGSATGSTSVVLAFLSTAGLLLLMFVAGSSVRSVLGRHDRGATGWILGVGTVAPFVVVIGLARVLPVRSIMGSAGNPTALVLVVAMAATVTSIPVIARIFSDLGILETRFAGLMLGMAVLEDVALWGVLAVATALVAASSSADHVAGAVIAHIAASILFMALGVTVVPELLGRARRASWNAVAARAPVAWVVSVLLAYVALAGSLDVTPAFAAFLAGFAVVGGVRGTERAAVSVPLETVSTLASSVFIPLYFALVGYRLDFTAHFSLPVLAVFLCGSSALRLAAVSLGARLAGFRGRDTANLAVTANARGGPGIVLATIAFDAGIINGSFFTALVVTALVTSQVCGVWLHRAIRGGRPLLLGDRRPIVPPGPVVRPSGAPVPPMPELGAQAGEMEAVG